MPTTVILAHPPAALAVGVALGMAVGRRITAPKGGVVKPGAEVEHVVQRYSATKPKYWIDASETNCTVMLPDVAM